MPEMSGGMYTVKSAIFLGGPRLCVFHARINLYRVYVRKYVVQQNVIHEMDAGRIDTDTV